MTTRRRDFLKMMAAGSVAGGGLAGLGRLLAPQARAAEGAAARPNVLMIVLDDMNDWIGCLGGNPDVKTPNLDRLARQSTLFTHAYCPAPICGPSRASFLTGMLPSSTGIYDNTQHYHDKLADHENLPLFMKKQGYHTMGAGKVFHGYYEEYWDESLNRGPRMYSRNQPKMNQTDIPGIFDWGPLDIPDEEMDDYRMAQFGVDGLGRSYDKPFFMAVGLYRPHVPWYAPRKYFDMYPLEAINMPDVKADDLDDVPPAGVRMANLTYTEFVEKSGKTREAIQAFLASITFTDAMVGRMLDALDASPYRDNTIVVVAGDNGLHQGEKRKWHKDSLWEEAGRVPLMMRVPGMSDQGDQCHRAVNLVDLFPTIATLVGAEHPDYLEGTDLTPLLRDPSAERTAPSITIRRKHETAVRLDDWRYIQYEDGSEELYHHGADPYEWTNLADRAQYRSVIEHLKGFVPARFM